MTTDAPSGFAVIETAAAPVQSGETSYVDWPAIFAGIVFASAISLVLMTFGSAVGLSFANFRSGSGAPGWAIGIAAASWLLWVQVSSFMAGGYLTGRLRRRHHDASEHESDVRDGAHGLIVWAGAAVLGSALVLGGVGSAANAVGAAASTVTQAAANVAGDVADNLDPNAYFVDTLFRPAANAVPSAAASATANLDASRAEAARIFVQAAASGQLAPDDKDYLVSVVQQVTGANQADAASRVDAAFNGIQAAKQQALDAAEAARKTAVLAAFLIAASFLVSAVGAYWAAMKGGNHRDNNTVFAGVFGRF